MGYTEAMSKDNYQCPAGVKELNIMGKMLGHMDTCNYHCLFVKKYLCLHWCIASFYIQVVFIFIDLDMGMSCRRFIEAAKAAVDDGEFMKREATWDVTGDG